MQGGVGQELLGLVPVHVVPVCGSGRKGDRRRKTSGFHVNPSSSVIRHFLQEGFVSAHSLTMFSFSTFGHSTLSHSMFSRQIYKF